MTKDQFVKDPAAVLDYPFDWAEWLDGDTITSATFTVPTGLTLDHDSHTATTATVWLAGGEVGERYTVTCHVVTAGGRTDERSIKVWVRDR